ncbi:NUMOD4 domain-containing protein [Staphylococcus saprophyticus]
MTENWKDVVGYEGIYEVSDCGSVRTHKDKTTYTSKHGIRKWKQRYLKDKTPNGRDVRVDLWKNGKPKYFLVHRLVAFAFIPLVKGKDCINHIDGNPKNNCVENLEWCNHLENNRHAFETGLIGSNMKVKLINDLGVEYEFISMAKADKWLERATGYTSGRLLKGHHIVIASDNTKYKVEKLI